MKRHCSPCDFLCECSETEQNVDKQSILWALVVCLKGHIHTKMSKNKQKKQNRDSICDYSLKQIVYVLSEQTDGRKSDVYIAFSLKVTAYFVRAAVCP